MSLSTRNSISSFSSFGFMLSDLDPVLGGWGQDIATAVSHDHHIFNADAAALRDVNARFDRNDHAGLEHVVSALCDSRRFVDLQTHAVPRGMCEKLPQTRVLQHQTGGAVHIGHSHT